MDSVHPIDAPENFINRELSWLAFNRRVLSEAGNLDNPLLERTKFLSIVSTNLDEFFMVRVASLRDQIRADYKKRDESGLRPREQLQKVIAATRLLIQHQYRLLGEDILPALHAQGIQFLTYAQLSQPQRKHVDDYFEKEIFPILTPMAVDGSHKFPLVANRSLNIALLLEGKAGKKPDFATVQVPGSLPRLLFLPFSGSGVQCIHIESIIMEHLSYLFGGRTVLTSAPYRITRNADLDFDEEEAADLLSQIEKSLKKRKWGAVIRLECESGIDERILHKLMEGLKIDDSEVYAVTGPIHLGYFMKELYKVKGYRHLKYKPFTPHLPCPFQRPESIFTILSEGDHFLYHPYDSFAPMVRFLQEAAEDDNVLAIKQTLYRVSGNSPIVAALGKAAQNGKQVTVLLEVKARFDEENNIQWGKQLEKAGCHVVYGLPGLKTHSKITLVVRKENGGLRRYVHLGTGNYNDVTATLYTDMGLFTTDSEIGEDAGHFFNLVTGYLETAPLKKLIYAPSMMRDAFLQLIRREEMNAMEGLPAAIDAKMNSLVDRDIILALYKASQAGVKVDLTVRGICCLRPGIPGISEGITVRSIVGRMLEHARIYRFENGGDPEYYLSSADWMPRNLDRRIELLFPVCDEEITDKIAHIMALQRQDTAKAWLLHPDGQYKREIAGQDMEPLNSQEVLIAEAERCTCDSAAVQSGPRESE